MSGAGGQEPIVQAAVASGTSAGGTSRLRRWERLELAGRILITVGAVLVAVGMWMPWKVVNGYAFAGDQRQNYTFALSPGNVEGIFGSLMWSALTILGLLLLPLVWWRSRPLISSLILILNAVWVLALSYSLPSGLAYGQDVFLVSELHPRYLVITHRGQWQVGFWIAVAGVSFVLVAALLSMVSNVFGQPQGWPFWWTDGHSDAARVRPLVALPGASALTIGLGLWAVSTFVMPWASVNCSTTPLFVGTCTGMPYTSVLRLGIADVTTLVDPMVARYAVGVLLGGGAAMILAGLWLRARSVAFCGWATLWLALAAGFAWLAEDGVGVVVVKHDTLGLQAGAWTGENAVLLTLLGFVLALAGLVYLWVDAVRHRDRRGGNAEA